VLGKLLRQVKYGGAVAAIGNAGGIELNTNVLPFILRGVSLLGVDSVMQPYAQRIAAWSRIVSEFDLAAYSDMLTETGLDQLPAAAEQILAGRVKGRILVNPRAAS
jgi:acrylyl-CoA reductase (NADPH)